MQGGSIGDGSQQKREVDGNDENQQKGNVSNYACSASV
jgi:hypothetical protein